MSVCHPSAHQCVSPLPAPGPWAACSLQTSTTRSMLGNCPTVKRVVWRHAGYTPPTVVGHAGYTPLGYVQQGAPLSPLGMYNRVHLSHPRVYHGRCTLTRAETGLILPKIG